MDVNNGAGGLGARGQCAGWMAEGHEYYDQWTE